MTTIVVTGDDRAALAVAREVAAQGGKAVLLRKRPRSCALRQPGGIDVVASELVGIRGTPGRMVAMLEDGELECAAVVLVDHLDRTPAPPPSMDLNELFDGPLPRGIIVIDLRDGPDRPGRARALELAPSMLVPGSRLIILADEVLAYGRDELLYREAQRNGALVVRPTALRWNEGMLDIVDQDSGEAISVRPDAFISEGALSVVPSAVPVTVSMGPMTTLREGVLHVRANLLDDELRIESAAAAALALRIKPPAGRQSARVDEERCSACLTCVRTCPFEAAGMNEQGKAFIDEERCQACGKCVAACTGRAIALPGSTDDELNARIRAAMEGA